MQSEKGLPGEAREREGENRTKEKETIQSNDYDDDDDDDDDVDAVSDSIGSIIWLNVKVQTGMNGRKKMSKVIVFELNCRCYLSLNLCIGNHFG